jgi:propionyl-CoA synthetase
MPGTFWRVIANTRSAQLLHRPHRAARDQARRSRGRAGRDYDLSNLQALFLAGERADPDTIHWAQRHAEACR